jgi:hypothetical protein
MLDQSVQRQPRVGRRGLPGSTGRGLYDINGLSLQAKSSQLSYWTGWDGLDAMQCALEDGTTGIKNYIHARSWVGSAN